MCSSLRAQTWCCWPVAKAAVEWIRRRPHRAREMPVGEHMLHRLDESTAFFREWRVLFIQVYKGRWIIIKPSETHPGREVIDAPQGLIWNMYYVSGIAKSPSSRDPRKPFILKLIILQKIDKNTPYKTYAPPTSKDVIVAHGQPPAWPRKPFVQRLLLLRSL